VVSSEQVVVDLLQGYVIFFVEVLGDLSKSATQSIRKRLEIQCTHNFAKQHDVFTSDEEQTMPAFSKRIPVVYPFYGIFKNKVGCTR